MGKIFPDEVVRNIYSYDPTYKEHVDKVLKQMMAHCFIYNCHLCIRNEIIVIAIVKCAKLISSTVTRFITMK